MGVDDRLSAKTLDAVVQAAAGPDQPTLRPLLDVLPIAGGSGTYAFLVGIQSGALGRGAAIALLLFPILLVIVFLVLRALTRRDI